MNKTLLLTTATALLLAGCQKENNKTPEEKQYLQQIEVKEYVSSYGLPGTTGETYETYTYDQAGNLLEFKSNYYSSWAGMRIPQSDTYTYDSKGRVAEKNSIDLLSSRSVYTYNATDSVAKEEIYNKYGLDKVITNTYGNDRKLTRKDVVDQDTPGLSQYFLYTYQGNTVTAQKYYTEENELSYTYVYEYDTHGNKLKETNIAPDNSIQVVYRAEYQYNPDKTVNRKTNYNLYDETKTSTYSYDEKGRIVSVQVADKQMDRDSELKYTYTYQKIK